MILERLLGRSSAWAATASPGYRGLKVKIFVANSTLCEAIMPPCRPKLWYACSRRKKHGVEESYAAKAADAYCRVSKKYWTLFEQRIRHLCILGVYCYNRPANDQKSAARRRIAIWAVHGCCHRRDKIGIGILYRIRAWRRKPTLLWRSQRSSASANEALTIFAVIRRISACCIWEGLFAYPKSLSTNGFPVAPDPPVLWRQLWQQLKKEVPSMR